MGIYSNAELIWGVPVAHSEHPELWSEEDEYWREDLGGELKVKPFGHYEDPDDDRGILTSTRIKSFRADCWDPVRIDDFDLSVSDKVPSKSTDQARAAGLDFNFYADAGWHLVTSVG